MLRLLWHGAPVIHGTAFSCAVLRVLSCARGVAEYRVHDAWLASSSKMACGVMLCLHDAGTCVVLCSGSDLPAYAPQVRAGVELWQPRGGRLENARSLCSIMHACTMDAASAFLYIGGRWLLDAEGQRT